MEKGIEFFQLLTEIIALDMIVYIFYCNTFFIFIYSAHPHRITLKTEVSSSTIESAAADSASEPTTASAERHMKEQFR